MQLTLTPDQELFGKAVRELLADACSSVALRAAWDSAGGRVPGLWSRLHEMGLLGLAAPESIGGIGGDDTDLVPVLVEAGRAALPEPLLATMVGARVLSGLDGAVAAGWASRVVAGETVVALGVGPGRLVGDATCADVFLLEAGGSLHAVPREAVAVTPQPSADPAARLGSVAWTPDAATLIGGGDVVALALDAAATAAAAQLVGLASGMLDLSVTYAKQRVQFGKPIGSFQAVKHQLADVYVATEFARPVVLRGAWSVARGLPSRARDASAAKHAAGAAAQLAARVALQVHGGIGYTFEHDLHMWLKRTWTLAASWGDAAWHRRRVAVAVLDDDQPRVP